MIHLAVSEGSNIGEGVGDYFFLIFFTIIGCFVLSFIIFLIVRVKRNQKEKGIKISSKQTKIRETILLLLAISFVMWLIIIYRQTVNP